MKPLAISILLLLPLCVWAQDEELNDDNNTNPFTNEVGFNAGGTTGIGLSYRHWFNRIGLQVTAMPFKLENDFFLSAGLTGLYSLRNTKYTRMYAYWGNHVFYLRESYYEQIGDQPILNYGSDTFYCSGIGIGFSFGRVVAFNISVGYAAYQAIGWGLGEGLWLLPTAEIGVYWRF